MGVGLDQRIANAQLVEQGSLGKAVIVLTPTFHRQAHQVAGQNRVGVAIAANCIRWIFHRARCRILIGINATGIEIEVISIGTRIKVWVGGGIDHNSTGHAHDVANANVLAWIIGIFLPFGYRCVLP